MKTHWKVAGNNIDPFDPTLYPNVFVDTTQMTSFILGWVVGIQYTSTAPSACFYTVADTIGSLDYFVNDWQNFIQYYQYYNLFVYDPIHFYGNLMSSYE